MSKTKMGDPVHSLKESIGNVYPFRIKISCKADRDATILAMVNAGYRLHLVEESTPIRVLGETVTIVVTGGGPNA